MQIRNLLQYLFENMDEAALHGFSLDILKKETQRLKEDPDGGYIVDIADGLSKLAEKYDLPYMGRGSSRVVYGLSTGKVLKISRDEKGIAQTEAEISVWTNPSTKEVAAQVFDFDPDYNWSVMEIAKTFENPQGNNYEGSLEYELKIPRGAAPPRLAGELRAYELIITIRDIVEELRSPSSDRSVGFAAGIEKKLKNISREGDRQILMRQKLEQYLENPHPYVNKIVELLKNNDLNIGDVVSDHFGKTADGRIVMIDYGFTENVADNYY